MNEYDFYIEDYFTYYFKNMKDDLIHRDYEIENQIITAGKIEYFLEKSFVSEEIANLKKHITSDLDGVEYKFKCDENNRFNYLQYKYNNDDFVRNKQISIQEVFNIKSKYFIMHVPLIEHYCKLNNMTDDKIPNIRKGIDTLSDILKIKKKQVIIDIPRINCARNSFEDLGLMENIYHYFDANSYYDKSIWVHYFEDRKIVIPLFYGDDKTRYRYCFFPLNGQLQAFFNDFCLDLYPKAIVIITDSIELAGNNQRILTKAGVSDIVWISFYCKDDFNRLNWSKLSNRSVYYLLKEHSGQGFSETKSIADAVITALSTIKVESFKYVSFLHSLFDIKIQSRYSKIIPTILTHGEFENFRKDCIYLGPSNYEFFKNEISLLAKKNELILSPLLYERSATLVYGDDLRSFFSLNLAFAISQNRKPFEGWNTGKKETKVLYIYGENGEYSFRDNLEVILKIYAARENIALTTLEKVSFNKVDADGPITFPNEMIGSTSIMPNKFFISIFDKSNQKYQFENAPNTFVLHQTKFITEAYPNHSHLLVLENLFDRNSAQSLSAQSILIMELKRRGWATIIVTHDKTTYQKKVSLDNVIKVRKISCDDVTKTKMSVSIKKCLKTPPIKDELELCCVLDLTAKHPTYTRDEKYNKPWSIELMASKYELYKKVLIDHEKGMKSKAIATKLCISDSMVKKIKTELKLTKKRKPKTSVTTYGMKT